MHRKVECRDVSIAVALMVAALLTGCAPAGEVHTRAWNQTLPVSERFVLVMGDQAVLDNETALVWHRFPDTSGSFTWGQAISGCWVSEFGGRLGWRLATIVELSTLIDRSQAPALPAGHPFVLNLPAPDVWSSTTTPGAPDEAQTMDIDGGFLGGSQKDGPVGLWRWCVRGGGGIEGQ